MNEHDATELAFKNGYKKCISEILDSIEGEINSAIANNQRRLLVNTDQRLCDYVQGKIHALRGIGEFVAEIKTKYKEE